MVRAAALRQALARADRDIESVLGWRKRAGPAGIEGTRWLRGEVEVEDQGAGRVVDSEVVRLCGIDQVAAGAIGLVAVRRVAERDEETSGVTGHPEHRQALLAGGDGESHRAYAPERERLGAAVRELHRERARVGGGRRLDGDDEPERRI